MKKYIFPCVYKRQQIFKSVWCKSFKDASKELGISNYQVKKYCYIVNEGEIFEGVFGHFDSGVLLQKESSLFMKLMPIEDLFKLINKYV